MLHLYLSPKNNPNYIPSQKQRAAFLRALELSQVASPSEQNIWVPSHAAHSLFDEDAKEALLPAELTFERLIISDVQKPLILPEERPDHQMVFCRACEDQLINHDFETGLKRAELSNLSHPLLFCPSCDAARTFKELTFDPPLTLACFWLKFEAMGTSRFNPRVLRSWGKLLGTALVMTVEEKLDEWEDEAVGSTNDLTEVLGIKPSRLRNMDRRTKRKHGISRSRKLNGVRKRRDRRQWWDDE